MSTLDWGALIAGADEAGFTRIDAGEYDAVVDTAEHAKTSGNDGKGVKDQIKVKFKVVNGPNAGKTVFNNFVLSPENPNALGFFFRHMAALGLTREYFEGGPPLAQVAAALVGRPCRIKVSVRTWQDEERNQVDKVLPPVGGPAGVPTAVGSPGAAYAPIPGMVPVTSAGVPGIPPVPQIQMPAVNVPPVPQVAVPPVSVPSASVTPPAPAPAAPAPMAPPPPLGEAIPGASDDLPF